MSEKSWEQIGREIVNTVDDAIRYGDFSNLSRSIGNVIYDTVDTMRGQTRSNWNYTNSGYGQASGYGQNSGYGQTSGYGQSSYEEPTIHPMQGNRTYKNRKASSLYTERPSGKLLGLLMAAGGFFFGFLFFLSMLLCLVEMMNPFAYMYGGAYGAAFLLLLVMTGGCLWIGYKGARRVRMINLYQSMLPLIGQRVNVPIAELAQRTGKKTGTIVKSIRRMIIYRWFYQAHIDPEEQYLILSDEAYEAFLQAKKNFALQRKNLEQQQKEQEKAQQAKQKAKDSIPEECRALIAEGEAYIAYIHESNARIPGEEISAKLAHMERLITRIFDVVKEHPEVADDLNKLMSYYLPTTKKLLGAYQELDGQPVAGANIANTKREIEEAIDTLNVAFEKLLDSLFENRAWDISSDISVLHTILAQDGLKEGAMRR